MPPRNEKNPSGSHDFNIQYEALRMLFNRNGDILQLMSDLEADLAHLRHGDSRVRRRVCRLLDESLLMAQELNLISGDKHNQIYPVLERIRSDINSMQWRQPEAPGAPLAVLLEDEGAADADLVGGKAVGVRALRRLFADNVPGGFCMTTAAYNLFITSTGLADRIRLFLQDIDYITDSDAFASITRKVRRLIMDADIPSSIEHAIHEFAGRAGASDSPEWAVRSSAIGEDSHFSFAGQYDSMLKVTEERLAEAYRSVVASRYTDRAIRYRLHRGFREVETPMAVLIQPMIDARAAGVIHTRDYGHDDPVRIVVHSVEGLGDKAVSGTTRPDTFYLSREETAASSPGLQDEGTGQTSDIPAYLTPKVCEQIRNLALRAASEFGHEMEIEWACDAGGKVWLLQGRRLTYSETPAPVKTSKPREAEPIVEGGVTIFPGRAEGPVWHVEAGPAPDDIPEGAVVVVGDPAPDLVAVLPRSAALIAERGNPAGHIATLMREFSVPGLFQVGALIQRLPADKVVVSINATKRKVYRGSRWPEVRDRVLTRISSGGAPRYSGPMYDLVSALNLTDPYASNFNAKSCRSIHDCVRFMHEMSIRFTFQLGDKEKRRWGRRTVKLKTDYPLRLHIIDLDDSIEDGKKSCLPSQVRSKPFTAWWKGVSDERLSWPDRWGDDFAVMPPAFKEQVLGGGKGPRGPRSANYAIVAGDYMNLNLRMSFHYATVDAIVGPGRDANHVHFRFLGGGGRREQREQRTRFLELVLRQSKFGVDRRGDLLEAWMRHYPRKDCEEALAVLGRLMVCARELDRFNRTDAELKKMAEHFMKDQFSYFA